MLSRVAESIYWAGRYIERAENTARFIDVNLQMGLDAPSSFAEQWAPMVAIYGSESGFKDRYDAPTRENVIEFMASDPLHPSSILSCLQKARENARSVREAISSEMWEQVNRYYLTVSNGAARRRPIIDPYQFFNEVKLLAQQVSGVSDNTMSHDQAWHFFQVGRLLERADNASRLLDVKYFLLLPSVEDVGGAVDEMQWSILLRSASAFEMYRKRYGRIDPHDVVEFLLLDKEFPRAIFFCVDRGEEFLRAISGVEPGRFSNPAEQRLGLLRSELAYAQSSDIITAGLHEFLDGLQRKLNAVGSAIFETYFALPTVRAAGASNDAPSGTQRQQQRFVR
jgi:uncharacterized alpha-E superfamily protein